jgi:hypothetical protein
MLRPTSPPRSIHLSWVALAAGRLRALRQYPPAAAPLPGPGRGPGRHRRHAGRSARDRRHPPPSSGCWPVSGPATCRVAPARGAAPVAPVAPPGAWYSLPLTASPHRAPPAERWHECGRAPAGCPAAHSSVTDVVCQPACPAPLLPAPHPPPVGRPGCVDSGVQPPAGDAAGRRVLATRAGVRDQATRCRDPRATPLVRAPPAAEVQQDGGACPGVPRRRAEVRRLRAPASAHATVRQAAELPGTMGCPGAGPRPADRCPAHRRADHAAPARRRRGPYRAGPRRPQSAEGWPIARLASLVARQLGRYSPHCRSLSPPDGAFLEDRPPVAVPESQPGPFRPWVAT